MQTDRGDLQDGQSHSGLSPAKKHSSRKKGHKKGCPTVKKDPNSIRFGLQKVSTKEDSISYEPIIDLNRHRLTAVKLNKYARSIERKQLDR